MINKKLFKLRVYVMKCYDTPFCKVRWKSEPYLRRGFLYAMKHTMIYLHKRLCAINLSLCCLPVICQFIWKNISMEGISLTLITSFWPNHWQIIHDKDNVTLADLQWGVLLLSEYLHDFWQKLKSAYGRTI